MSTHSPQSFQARHIGPTADDQAKMLASIGYQSLDELIASTIPAALRREQPFELPAASESQALAELSTLAKKNQVKRSLIGQGYYNCHTPAVIQRNVLENPSWYTAYTPYQPEISQGRLEALANFQTMICDLTGMDIANASMLDEATATAEAVTLALRCGQERKKVWVASDVLPQSQAVLRTRMEPLGVDIVVQAVEHASQAQDCVAAVFAYPGVNGDIHDLKSVAATLRASNTLVIVCADLLALTLLSPPGEWGADVVVGTTQRLGVPLGFGGPHAAYMAVKDPLKRNLPGRLVGLSVDAHGAPAYRLALQTREQHIRREKATSNICTAQVLPAVLASMFAVYHGPEGLRAIAQQIADLTATLAAALQAHQWPLDGQQFFDTLVVRTGAQTEAVHQRALQVGYNLRRIDEQRLGISLDETVSLAELEKLLLLFAIKTQALSLQRWTAPHGLARSSAYLSHPVFHRHHSETAMLRYLKMLADKDLALDRAMIPLGSCTMKLNATSEMFPISWPEFALMHPHAPQEQTQGYAELASNLSTWLAACTGYDHVSLQPNAGSQGEYAGLLAIRAWQRARGQSQRNVCLIPSSAHGTNPASAHMVGMDVVVVACDAQGNIDMADLQAKAEQHSDKLAACMVTYPSTHGVFEAGIKQLADIIHQHGGQVYVDGANLNALVGLVSLPELGADVSHLNLHKTFCIPHGGGGPGVGPVAVRKHLAAYLPADPMAAAAQTGNTCVSAAALGNAGVLPISWMYIRMMGSAGLKRASEVAILSANYVAKHLSADFPVLYSGANGLVAHECILDLRGLKEETGISNEDVAKRLIDHGFHAPTMSFPVPGTLMVEPTESEPLSELDRFIAAMRHIRSEIENVKNKVWSQQDNPLRLAPFTVSALLTADWPHAFSREQAAFPGISMTSSKATPQKYWPAVGRVDNVWGDRNLFCACAPVTD